MNPAVEPGRVEALFEQVVDLPRAEAIRVLDMECEHTPELRVAVERLLARDRALHEGFLEPDTALAAEALGVAAGISASPPPEPVLRDSERIGRFLVLQLLGQGAMGAVYDAYDESLERRVAVKVLGRGLGSHESMAREGQALARLAHPNVVPIYEIGQDADRLFVAMELVRGRTLRKWLEERPRSRDEVLRVFRQAGEGLAAAHRTGLVHRDFKPDNVLLGDDGRVRVVDFGVAALAVGASPSHGITLIGTPAFMAPEQFLGERATPAVDQFAFCVAIYRALVGAAPFEGEGEVLALRRNVLAGALRPPPSPLVPNWLSRILLRGLARDAAARFSTMDALLAAIDRHLPPSRELDPNVGRRERRLLAWAMAVFGGAVLTVVWALRAFAHRPFTLPALIALPGAGVTGLALAAFFLRRRLLGNRFARNVASVVALSMVAVVLHRLLALHLGESVPAVVSVDLFEMGMQMAIAATLLDRAFAFPASFFLGGSLVSMATPEWAVTAYMGAITASCIVGAVLWARDV